MHEGLQVKGVVSANTRGMALRLDKAKLPTLVDDFDVDIYDVNSMRALAEQFVEEGLFGDIPERLQFYIDYDAIARDLAVDYSEAVIASSRVIYRCG